MVLMAGVDIPDKAVREQAASALHIIVHLSRLPDGSRRVTQIAEVVGMEGATITLQDIYAFDFRAGRDDEGRYLGTLQPTGIRPQFTDRLLDSGIELDPELFGSLDDRLRKVARARR
jgi:pilus assembly protein CpaF